MLFTTMLACRVCTQDPVPYLIRRKADMRQGPERAVGTDWIVIDIVERGELEQAARARISKLRDGFFYFLCFFRTFLMLMSFYVTFSTYPRFMLFVNTCRLINCSNTLNTIHSNR